MDFDPVLLFPLFPLAVGALFLGVGIRIAVGEYRFLRRAHRTTGTSVPTGNGTLVRFRTREGEEVTASSRVARRFGATPPGRTLTVLYAPEDPREIRLHGLTGTFLLPGLVFCCLGALAAAAGAVLAVLLYG
ncbi:hypothetical protein HDA32_004312 [Spinactinospora alkalitolerans]|uniref:DUF3592 domain-containing protein n=1 Tax=Spinactinospora alkalitolerans TaxID=687207 RepID=A0A852U1H3_9ACTN|nr:DUF3592 domain-containing protein [Spinactinospora alkalitolerans]NYE49192.1 hypothetical protein [Spinactinospora alkalitolerans]